LADVILYAGAPGNGDQAVTAAGLPSRNCAWLGFDIIVVRRLVGPDAQSR